MSCETDTTRTGPLTYSWKMDDGEWKEADQKLPINKTEHSGVKTFTCRVKNPLGVLMESDPGKNQLFKKEKESGGLGNGGIAGIIITVFVLIGVGGYMVGAKIFKKWPFNQEVSSDTDAPLSTEEKADPHSNGDSNNPRTADKEEPNHGTRLLDKQGEESANADAAIGEDKV